MFKVLITYTNQNSRRYILFWAQPAVHGLYNYTLTINGKKIQLLIIVFFVFKLSFILMNVYKHNLKLFLLVPDFRYFPYIVHTREIALY